MEFYVAATAAAVQSINGMNDDAVNKAHRTLALRGRGERVGKTFIKLRAMPGRRLLVAACCLLAL